METRVLVTFANPYDLTTDEGQHLTGLTINYFFLGEDTEQFKCMQNLNKGPVGYQRAKCSLTADKINKIVYVPGIYQASLVMAVGADGKPALKVDDLIFESQVALTALD